MYIFTSFDKATQMGVLYKVIKPYKPEDIFAEDDIVVKTVKCYPNYHKLKRFIIDCEMADAYVPIQLGKGLVSIKTIEDDTLIDVDTESLAKLYVEVNKAELFENGNLPLRGD